MIQYNAGGTVGDAYVHICRLYHQAKTEKIRVYHTTRHRFWHGLIQRVYLTLPNVGVCFRESAEPKIKRIESITPEWFPDFEFANAQIHFGFPDDYICVNMKSGRPTQGFRRIAPEKMDAIMAENRSVVLIGDDTPDPYTHPNIIDLRGKTTIWEAFWIVKHAKYFHGFQGCMSFVACSQKVPCSVYVKKGEDKVAVKGNILNTPWSKYCREVVQT